MKATSVKRIEPLVSDGHLAALQRTIKLIHNAENRVADEFNGWDGYWFFKI
jgi:hypothetical protein